MLASVVRRVAQIVVPILEAGLLEDVAAGCELLMEVLAPVRPGRASQLSCMVIIRVDDVFLAKIDLLALEHDHGH